MNHTILLSHWNGRFGNRLFQVAYGNTFAQKTGYEFILPSEWEGFKLFKLKNKVLENDYLRLHLNQSIQPFDNIHYRISKILEHIPNSIFVNVDNDNPYKIYNKNQFFDSVCAYNKAMFDGMNKDFLLNLFEFNDYVKSLDSYKKWSDKAGTYDIAHVRRDDIANAMINKSTNCAYNLISLESYYKAFEKYGFDKDKIIWVSDDNTGKYIQEPKLNLNWSYPVGAEFNEKIGFDFLEDFFKIYFARNIFRANSSFSWWASFLSPTAINIYAPKMKERSVFGIHHHNSDGILTEFVKGNHPHFIHGFTDININ